MEATITNFTIVATFALGVITITSLVIMGVLIQIRNNMKEEMGADMDYFTVSGEIVNLIRDVFHAGSMLRRTLDDGPDLVRYGDLVTLLDDWDKARQALEAYLNAL